MRILNAALAGIAGLASLAGCEPVGAAGPVEQPLAFNHKLHIEQDMACTDCHAQVERGPHATFPRVKTCLLCHEEPQGEHPHEPRIRAYAEQGLEIPWIQVNRLPGHVYFSHEAHVRYAGMSCADCHGDMERREEPVTEVQIGHLDMDRCVSCHEQNNASSDCLRCHK